MRGSFWNVCYVFIIFFVVSKFEVNGNDDLTSNVIQEMTHSNEQKQQQKKKQQEEEEQRKQGNRRKKRRRKLTTESSSSSSSSSSRQLGGSSHIFQAPQTVPWTCTASIFSSAIKFVHDDNPTLINANRNGIIGDYDIFNGEDAVITEKDVPATMLTNGQYRWKRLKLDENNFQANFKGILVLPDGQIAFSSADFLSPRPNTQFLEFAILGGTGVYQSATGFAIVRIINTAAGDRWEFTLNPKCP